MPSLALTLQRTPHTGYARGRSGTLVAAGVTYMEETLSTTASNSYSPEWGFDIIIITLFICRTREIRGESEIAEGRLQEGRCMQVRERGKKWISKSVNYGRSYHPISRRFYHPFSTCSCLAFIQFSILHLSASFCFDGYKNDILGV